MPTTDVPQNAPLAVRGLYLQIVGNNRSILCWDDNRRKGICCGLRELCLWILEYIRGMDTHGPVHILDHPLHWQLALDRFHTHPASNHHLLHTSLVHQHRRIAAGTPHDNPLSSLQPVGELPHLESSQDITSR